MKKRKTYSRISIYETKRPGTLCAYMNSKAYKRLGSPREIVFCNNTLELRLPTLDDSKRLLVHQIKDRTGANFTFGNLQRDASEYLGNYRLVKTGDSEVWMLSKMKKCAPS